MEKSGRQGACNTKAALTTATLLRRVPIATEDSSNATAVPQMRPAELSALAKRLRNRAESMVLRDQPELQRDMRTAGDVIDGVARSSDLLVDVTDSDGTVSRSIPLWEAVGDDEVDYQDCRATLLADGKCATGGGAAPVYFLELLGNPILIDVQGSAVVAVAGFPPGTGYVIRCLDAAAGGA
jgi:hypothetical protein